MRQLQLLEPGKVELKEVPIPHAESGEVVLKIKAALTCGTDLKTFRRGHPKFKLPMPFGHEFSGDTVVASKTLKSEILLCWLLLLLAATAIIVDAT